jgi:hypothetical protein
VQLSLIVGSLVIAVTIITGVAIYLMNKLNSKISFLNGQFSSCSMLNPGAFDIVSC